MNKYLAALSASAMIGMAPHVLAASSTDLSVTGAITPSACTPSMSNGGLIDHGKISRKDLNTTTYTVIGTHTLQLMISCEAPSTFALRSIDNRPNTASNRDWYGLGKTDAGENIGFIIQMMKSTLADGQPGQSIVSRDGKTWGRHHHLRPNLLIAVASPADHSTPILAKDASFEVGITSHIARTDSLTLTDEVTLDGSVTFELTYF